jgi:hypothetical protein
VERFSGCRIMVRKAKSKTVEPKKVEDLACSALSIDDELIFCPLFVMPIRLGALACDICTWKDKKTENKLYKEFMKKVKKKE